MGTTSFFLSLLVAFLFAWDHRLETQHIALIESFLKFYFLCSIKQLLSFFLSKLNASLVMYPSQINHQIPHNSQQIQHQRQQQQPPSQDSISVQGIPSVTIQDNHLLIGTSQSSMFSKITLTPPLPHL